MPPKAFIDLATLPEDERIVIIGQSAEAGNTCAVFVDDDTVADRYVKKLKKYQVQIITRMPGLTPGTVLLKVGPKGH
jgi:tetrahydromethanopterin S-methyltransferase subunit F